MQGQPRQQRAVQTTAPLAQFRQCLNGSKIGRPGGVGCLAHALAKHLDDLECVDLVAAAHRFGQKGTARLADDATSGFMHDFFHHAVAG